MATPTKIKVSRVALLEKLREVEGAHHTAHEAVLDQYYKDEPAFRKAFAEALRALAYEIMHGADLDSIENEYRGGVRLGIPNLQKPSMPKVPGDDLGKLIRTLELSTEDTIVVSASDSYYRYL